METIVNLCPYCWKFIPGKNAKKLRQALSYPESRVRYTKHGSSIHAKCKQPDFMEVDTANKNVISMQ